MRFRRSARRYDTAYWELRQVGWHAYPGVPRQPLQRAGITGWPPGAGADHPGARSRVRQRGVESRLELARLPWVKSLDQFDFDFQPSIDRKQVRELARLSFVSDLASEVAMAENADDGRKAKSRRNGVRSRRAA